MKSHPTTTESIMKEYSDVFDNKTLGRLPVQHTIRLKEEAKTGNPRTKENPRSVTHQSQRRVRPHATARSY